MIVAVVAITVWFTACVNSEEVTAPNTTGNSTIATEKSTTTATTGWSQFTHVPQGILDEADNVWGSVPPAVTIAFSYNGVDLEDGWNFSVWAPGVRCDVGEETPYYNRGFLTTDEGFVFLEEDDLCDLESFVLDNRQGGWFDYVCGPDSRNVAYNGDPVFVYVRLWCE